MTVTADSLPALARAVEVRGLTFRFANRWVNTHPGMTAGSALPPGMWDEFTAFLGAEKVKADAKALASERESLQRSLRRELARRISGDAAAARVALEGDVVFARALKILARAKSPADVFAAAGLETPRAGAPAQR